MEVTNRFKGLDLIEYLEKAMATHSSTLAWKIPWTEEPGRLQSMGSLRVGHLLDYIQFSLIHGPNIPGSYTIGIGFYFP